MLLQWRSHSVLPKINEKKNTAWLAWTPPCCAWWDNMGLTCHLKTCNMGISVLWTTYCRCTILCIYVEYKIILTRQRNWEHDWKARQPVLGVESLATVGFRRPYAQIQQWGCFHVDLPPYSTQDLARQNTFGQTFDQSLYPHIKHHWRWKPVLHVNSENATHRNISNIRLISSLVQNVHQA
jgi:hypothetical protein